MMDGEQVMDDWIGAEDVITQQLPDLINVNDNSLYFDEFLANQPGQSTIFGSGSNPSESNHQEGIPQAIQGLHTPMHFYNQDVKPITHLPDTPQQLLDKIQTDSRVVDEEISKIRTQIINSYSNINQATYSALLNQITNLLDMTQRARSKLEEIVDSMALSIWEYAAYEPRQVSLYVQERQLSIYQQELMMFAKYNNQSPLTAAPEEEQYALVIAEKPSSEVVFKERPFSRAFKVQLLTPAIYLYKKTPLISECRGTASLEPGKQKKGAHNRDGNNSNSSNAINDTKILDKSTLSASFQPMFSTGTRKNTTSLRFNLTLTFDGTKAIRLMSEESNHFVVITNESQWGEAQGKLCKRDIFKGSEETTWCRFINVFNMHFVLSTRQSLNSNEEFRALSQDDFNYLHSKWFEGKPSVSIRSFDKFWNWFRYTLHLLRYQKKVVGGLWRSGLLYGFITKDGVNRALSDQQDGTFLIRFSETREGSFAVAYKHENMIKHYLVKPDEKKTLPDFVNETPFFKFVLKLKINSQGFVEGLTRVNKSEALTPFVAQHARGPNTTEDENYSELPIYQ